MEHVLESLLDLTTFLQANCVTTVEGKSRDMCSIYEGVVELAAKFEVQPSKPCWKTKRRENVPADTPCQYWKRTIYLPFMDHLLQGMNTQLLEAEDRYVA